MEDCAPSTFWGIGLWWLFICVLGFISLIDPFWKNMFLKLRGDHVMHPHTLRKTKSLKMGLSKI
jgi:hypothetical protein